MEPQLRDKRCLLVGGTSGIGLAAARRFLQQGAAVFVAGLDAAACEPVRAELQRLGRADTAACDATDPAAVDTLVACAIQALGGLDVLVHFAGGSGRTWGDGALHECTETGWQYTLDTNLKSTFLTNRAAVRHFLAARQPGVLLNTASVLGVAPSPHHFDVIAYAAAKGGVVALSRHAAARYAADGIRVNVLAPGFIESPMTRRGMENPAILDFLKSKQPVSGGPGLPIDCAEAAVFLCSDAARLLTGVVLPVDGGWCVSEGQWTGLQ